MLWDLLYTSTENDYIDFKQKWYEKTSKGKFDMVHDILAMANSLSDTENRFIFIGVAEHRETEKKHYLMFRKTQIVGKQKKLYVCSSTNRSFI